MQTKRIVKIVIDILMFFVFVYLMAYRPGSGLLPHGIFGTILFTLFIVHHILNINWYKAIPKGKYNARRIFLLVIDVLLFVCMILMAISSMSLSGMIFYNSPFPLSMWGRALHSVSNAWGFTLMAIHVGFHTNSPFNKLEKKLESKKIAFKIIYYVLSVIIFGICVFFFAASGILQKMFFIPTGDYLFYTTIGTIFQLILSTLGICIAEHWILKLFSRF